MDEVFALPNTVIFEIDDLLTEVPEYNPHFEMANRYRPYVLDAIRRADAVTVSTPTLAEAYARLNSRIYVLPNLVDTEIFRRRERRPGRPVTIAYTGTPTHREDLAMIEPAIRRVQERFGERIRFWFMGCITEALAALPMVEFAPMQPDYRRYAKTLSNSEVDIALVPLLDNAFNRCKSNIKWLEYSACGTAGIYADLPPYSNSVVDGETGILAQADETSWVDAISALVVDEERRQRISEAAYREVVAHHSLQGGAEAHYRTYERIYSWRISTGKPFRCSIVIPVFNRIELTQQCLHAIERVTELVETEVIVVDNGSADGTAEFLRSLGGRIRFIRNEENLGFAGACNQGAKAARGEFLLFLNNDTIPQQNWLEPLLREAERHPEIGIVGSKLLYPNGKIQHAGVGISRPEGVPYHIYQGAPADHPATERRRELRAVTGACMLVRRSLFDALDGFDEVYRNGFEDIDLCLRAAKRRVKIVYQPRSVVVHLEEQTIGRKDFDSENLRRFLATWGDCCFPDETGVLLEDGFIVRKGLGAAEGHRVIVPVPSPTERVRWERVAATERVLAEFGLAGVLSAPPEPEAWPDDVEVLYWGASVCARAELPEIAETFEQRIEILEKRNAAERGIALCSENAGEGPTLSPPREQALPEPEEASRAGEDRSTHEATILACFGQDADPNETRDLLLAYFSAYSDRDPVSLVFLTTDDGSTRTVADLHAATARTAGLDSSRTPLTHIEQVSVDHLGPVTRDHLLTARAVARLGGVHSRRLENLARTLETPILPPRPGPEILRGLAARSKLEATRPKTLEPSPLMRILIVVHNYPTERAGGTEIYARGLAHALRARGMEITVLYPKPEVGLAEPLLVEGEDLGMRVVRLRVPDNAIWLSHIFNPRLERVFGDFLRRERFDVVHFQHTWMWLPFSLIPIASHLGMRVCLSLHDGWFLCHQTHLFPPSTNQLCSGPETLEKCVSCYFVCNNLSPDRNFIRGMLEVQAQRRDAAQLALDSCDVVTAPSRYLIGKYSEHGFGSDRIRCAPLGLAPVERVEPRALRPLAFGFLGAVVPLKDPLLLARAFRQTRGDACLTFFGWGSDPVIAELQRWVESDPRIRYAGPYRPDRLGHVLSELDVLVLPSQSENYPLVIREALSAGIPVIASRVGGIPEIVEHRGNGLLFEPGDERGLAACLQALIDDASLVERLRRGVRPVKTLDEDAAEWIERYRALGAPSVAEAARSRS